MEIDVYDIYDDLYGVIDWYECHHEHTYVTKKGVRCCADCNRFYNENTLEWDELRF